MEMVSRTVFLFLGKRIGIAADCDWSLPHAAHPRQPFEATIKTRRQNGLDNKKERMAQMICFESLRVEGGLVAQHARVDEVDHRIELAQVVLRHVRTAQPAMRVHSRQTREKM
jgi:hypothetical protein